MSRTCGADRAPFDSARRRFAVFATAALLQPAAALAASRDAAPLVEVWKSPTCGCCHEWVAHLEANGFRTLIHDSGNTARRARLGIAERHGSCHTAVVDGYAIEGHVPAAEIHRLLQERPAAIGLAVPGMPIGSPGMDGREYRGRRDPYDVLLLAKDGSSSIYRSHR